MKFFKGIFLSILIIVLFISTSGLLFLFPIKNALVKENVKKFVQNIEVEKIVDESPELKKELDDLFEPIYEVTRELGVKDEVVIKLIDSKEVKGIFGDVTGNLVNYAVTGKNQKLITNDDIEKLVSDAIDDINASGYYEIKTSDKNKIISTIKKETDKYQEMLPDTSVIETVIEKEDHKYLDMIHLVLGSELEMYLILVMTISILLIMLLKWKNASWLNWTSITVGIAAFLSAIVNCLLLLFSKMILEDYDLSFDVVSHLLKACLKLSVIILVVMIILGVVYSIIRHKKDKIKA